MLASDRYSEMSVSYLLPCERPGEAASDAAKPAFKRAGMDCAATSHAYLLVLYS